jgi:single-strand DNA-binding protein
MASFNKVLIMGRLTRDPELRYTPSNTPVADFGFAMSEVFKNKAGETVEQTCFVDVVVWGRQAETTNEFLKKGSPAFIEGRLQFEQWETQQGEKRNKLKVRADRVQFLSSNKSESSENNKDQQDSSLNNEGDDPSDNELDAPPF